MLESLQAQAPEYPRIAQLLASAREVEEKNPKMEDKKPQAPEPQAEVKDNKPPEQQRREEDTVSRQEYWFMCRSCCLHMDRDVSLAEGYTRMIHCQVRTGLFFHAFQSEDAVFCSQCLWFVSASRRLRRGNPRMVIELLNQHMRTDHRNHLLYQEQHKDELGREPSCIHLLHARWHTNRGVGHAWHQWSCSKCNVSFGGVNIAAIHAHLREPRHKRVSLASDSSPAIVVAAPSKKRKTQDSQCEQVPICRICVVPGESNGHSAPPDWIDVWNRVRQCKSQGQRPICYHQIRDRVLCSTCLVPVPPDQFTAHITSAKHRRNQQAKDDMNQKRVWSDMILVDTKFRSLYQVEHKWYCKRCDASIVGSDSRSVYEHGKTKQHKRARSNLSNAHSDSQKCETQKQKGPIDMIIVIDE